MSPTDHQEAHATAPAEGDLYEDHKREQRARLILALSRFKPSDANPQQFYNCVREQCIIHNCSIDEGLERAAITWPRLSEVQRKTYDSQRHAELPIPVPRHLLYHALQNERNGLLSLGRSYAGGKQRYTLESYKPPQKPSKLKAQQQKNRPKYDNRLNLDPKAAAMWVPPAGKRKATRASPSSFRRIRNILPPPTRKVRPIRHILPMPGTKITKRTKRRRHGKLKKKLCALESDDAVADEKVTRRKKVTKRKGSKAKRLAKKKARAIINDVHWEQAVVAVRRHLMLSSRS